MASPESISGLNVEAIHAALACLNAASTEDARAISLLTDLRDYDIPMARSPKAESESLEKLLQTTKSVALVGLTASGAAVVGALNKGEYVAALICAGTGSAVTLIFISTIAVGALLASKTAQHIRSSKRRSISASKKESDTQKGEAQNRQLERGDEYFRDKDKLKDKEDFGRLKGKEDFGRGQEDFGVDEGKKDRDIKKDKQQRPKDEEGDKG
jgi:hypothetical protein